MRGHGMFSVFFSPKFPPSYLLLLESVVRESTRAETGCGEESLSGLVYRSTS
jgi:hypothetical protein